MNMNNDQIKEFLNATLELESDGVWYNFFTVNPPDDGVVCGGNSENEERIDITQKQLENAVLNEDGSITMKDDDGGDFVITPYLMKRVFGNSDPYANLKAAYEAGKMIQEMCCDGWGNLSQKDKLNFAPDWKRNPECYRIAPE